MLSCPRCETPLRLVVDTSPGRSQRETPKSRSFRIYDLLGVTALVAIHFAAFRANASTRGGGGEWTVFLWFTPIILACLVHFRLRLNVRLAMIGYYFLTLLYTFAASVGQSTAINSYRLQNPGKGRDTAISTVEYAISETTTMAVLGLALAAVYGLVCYTAIHSHAPRSPTAANQDGG